jgi:hypothetical protein
VENSKNGGVGNVWRVPMVAILRTSGVKVKSPVGCE